MTGNEKTPPLISIDQAARELGTTPLNVLMQIKRGRLAGEEVDGAWHVTAASLTELSGEGCEPKAALAFKKHCGNGRGCSSCG